MGIAAVIPARFRLIPHASLIAVAAGVGALVVLIVTMVAPELPEPRGLGLRSYTFTVLLPIALLGLSTMIMVALLRAASHRVELIHQIVPLLLIAFVMGFSIPNVAGLLVTQPVFRASTLAVIPEDGVAAARWLRANSDPSDLVATNLHCRVEPSGRICDARHFWVSGASERRVLVEGWAYTQRAIDIALATDENSRRIPFWDPALLALNDAAFTTPSSENLATLRDHYGVRWLFASLVETDAESLDRLATLRNRVGDYAVYQLTPSPRSPVGD